jgi:hypothetical protein
MAGQRGMFVTPHQFGKEQAATAFQFNGYDVNRMLLPDVTLWAAGGHHHEIKHKAPWGRSQLFFGLEKYRFNALLAFVDMGNDVYYTIHRHDWAGGRDVRENHIEHWVTAHIAHLHDAIESGRALSSSWSSWMNGRKKDNVSGWKFHENLFVPLMDVWDGAICDN